MCSFISIFLIVLFVISPLGNFSKTSMIIKVIIIIILTYTFYLNVIQTNEMKLSYNNSKTQEVTNLLNTNIICSYFFSFFIGLLIIFVTKSLF
jgi:hypothetical protein